MRLGIGKIRSIGLACALVTAATPVSAAPVDDAQKTELNITAGDAVLAGTLYRPAGAQGDLPAVVVGHGSGKVTRENTYWINAALSTGLAIRDLIAVLVRLPERTRRRCRSAIA